MNPQNETLVAVYGSLRRDFSNHRLIQFGGGEDLGNGTADGWRMYSWGGFPAICPDEGSSVVVEVYRVDAKTLRNLDGLEGYSPTSTRNEFYDRKTTTVRLDNGETVEALIYCMTEERASREAPLVKSGDWKEYSDRKRSDLLSFGSSYGAWR